MRNRLKRLPPVWLAVIFFFAAPVAGPAVAVDVGDIAPDFTLPSTTGENISLHQFRDKKVVLIEFHINDFGMT